jgi:hypothetical protein
MNFHTPERLPNESFEQYKVRRKLASRLVKVSKTGQITAFQNQMLEKFKRGEIK